MLFLKMDLGDGLAACSQTVRSLLIPLASKASLENDLSMARIDSTKSEIRPSGTLPCEQSQLEMDQNLSLLN